MSTQLNQELSKEHTHTTSSSLCLKAPQSLQDHIARSPEVLHWSHPLQEARPRSPLQDLTQQQGGKNTTNLRKCNSLGPPSLVASTHKLRSLPYATNVEQQRLRADNNLIEIFNQHLKHEVNI